jgi:hypothetical protein
MTLLKNASETVRGELEVANRELVRYKKAHGKSVGSHKDKDYDTELHDLRVTIQTLSHHVEHLRSDKVHTHTHTHTHTRTHTHTHTQTNTHTHTGSAAISAGSDGRFPLTGNTSETVTSRPRGDTLRRSRWRQAHTHTNKTHTHTHTHTNL